MDFSSRGPAPLNNRSSNQVASTPSSSSNIKKALAGGRTGKLWQIGALVLLFSITLLIITITFLMYFGKGVSEAKHVNTKQYQAVFLNNGQVYFGNIKDLNSRYIDLQNIYYLQTSGTGETANANTNTSTNVSLVKLGCELHAPIDQMLINNTQVLFWENLQDSGQVAKAIAEYKKQNPKGQNCSAASQSSTQQAPGNSTQTPTQNTPTTTTPTNTNTTTKKP